MTYKKKVSDLFSPSASHHSPPSMRLDFSDVEREDQFENVINTKVCNTTMTKQTRTRTTMHTILVPLVLLWAFCWCRTSVAFVLVPSSSHHSFTTDRVSQPKFLYNNNNNGKRGSGHAWDNIHQRRRRLDSSTPSPSSSALFMSWRGFFGGIETSGLVYDCTDTAFGAWEWLSEMGAPSALVAGAVLVTLSETRERSWPRKRDRKKTRLLKQSMRFLLLTAFALEVVSIFVATITGGILLGRPAQTITKKLVGYTTPLQLLHHHHEFEYLTTQICFLQGLLNWLGASAIELYLPRYKETKSAIRMNKCLAAWLTSLIIWIVAFYNHHQTFYGDYFGMIVRWCTLFGQRYVLEKPIRPLSLLYIPSFIYSMYLTVKAFSCSRDEDH